MEIDNPNLSSISSRAIKFWWVLVITSILGALLGWSINRTLVKPFYIATSSFSASINFYRLGHLTQYEQDQFYSNLLAFLKSDQVVNSTINGLPQPQIGTEQFRDICFLERQLSEILFRCKGSNPEQAKFLSTKWKGQALEELKDALFHAQRYQQLMDAQKQIETCIQKSALGLNSPYLCEIPVPDPDIRLGLDREKELSYGIFQGFTLVDGQNSGIPQRAERNQTNLMVLFGALTGFLIAISTIQIKRL